MCPLWATLGESVGSGDPDCVPKAESKSGNEEGMCRVTGSKKWHRGAKVRRHKRACLEFLKEKGAVGKMFRALPGKEQ